MPSNNDSDTAAVGDEDRRGPDAGADGDAAGERADGGDDRGPASKAEGAKRRGPAESDDPADSDSSADGDANVDLSDILSDLTDPEKASARKQSDDAKADDGGEEREDDDEERDDDAADDEDDASSEPEDEGDDEDGDDATAKDEADEATDDAEDKDAEDDDAKSELTEAELKRLPKRTREEIQRLVKLKPAARFGADVAEAAKAGGYANEKTLFFWLQTGGIVNKAPPEKAVDHLLGIALNVHTKGQAAKLPPAERATLLRKLADRIHPAPPPRVVTLPEDLTEAVSSEAISKEEAELIAVRRLEKADAKKRKEQGDDERPPAREERADDQPDEAQAETERERREAIVETRAGVKAALKVYKEFALKFPRDWKRLYPEIVKRVKARVERTHPADFAEMVRDQCDVVVNRRRAAPRTPPKSPPGGKRAPTRPADESGSISDDDLLAMTIGEKEFPKYG